MLRNSINIMKNRFFFILLVACSMASCVRRDTSGIVKGTVLTRNDTITIMLSGSSEGRDGTPLEGVMVYLAFGNDGKDIVPGSEVTSDANGKYSISVKKGAISKKTGRSGYSVVAKKDGYKPLAQVVYSHYVENTIYLERVYSAGIVEGTVVTAPGYYHSVVLGGTPDAREGFVPVEGAAVYLAFGEDDKDIVPGSEVTSGADGKYLISMKPGAISKKTGKSDYSVMAKKNGYEPVAGEVNSYNSLNTIILARKLPVRLDEKRRENGSKARD